MGLSNLLWTAGVSFMMFNVCAAEPRSIPEGIIPAPQSVKILPGNGFTITPGQTRIKLTGKGGGAAAAIAKNLAVRLGVEIDSAPEEKGMIVLHTEAETSPETAYPNPAGERYTLAVNDEKILLSAPNPRGMALAVQSLLQLCPPEIYSAPEAVKIPAVVIDDSPAYGYRGMHFDVVRHFFTIEEVKKFLDVMTLHKLNTFHWHLTDDQGWRIEIKKYPKLTQVGAIRRESPLPWNRNKGDGKPYGPYFFTQDQVREVIAYAAERQIEVIPEIELPGHAQAALAAYPELGCTGGPYEPWTKWGVSDNVFCAGNDSTVTFLKDVLTEVAALFPSRYLHIGGDECPKDKWATCPKCQKRVQDKKLGNTHFLQSWIVTEMGKFLDGKGKTMIGWDEILEGGIPPGAVIMSWRGAEGGIHAAKAKHQVIMTPNSHLYFDYAQSAMPGEPESIGSLIPLEKVYSMDPAFGMPPEDAKQVLGAQANLWAEYFFNIDALFYHALPRMSALSELTWTHKKDFESFRNRLVNNMMRYDNLGVNFRFMPPELPTRKSFRNETILDFGFLPKGFIVKYKINSNEWVVFTKPVAIKETCKVTYFAELPSGKKSREAVCDFISTLPQPAPISESQAQTMRNDLKRTIYKGRFQCCDEIAGGEKIIGDTDGKFSIAAPNIPINDYGILWEGCFFAPEEAEYTFSADSDDGSNLYVNGIRIVDYDGLHGVGTPKKGTLFLQKGWHTLKAQWFDAGGAKALQFGVSIGEKEEIRLEKLLLKHL